MYTARGRAEPDYVNDAGSGFLRQWEVSLIYSTTSMVSIFRKTAVKLIKEPQVTIQHL